METEDKEFIQQSKDSVFSKRKVSESSSDGTESSTSTQNKYRTNPAILKSENQSSDTKNRENSSVKKLQLNNYLNQANKSPIKLSSPHTPLLSKSEAYTHAQSMVFSSKLHSPSPKP